MQLDSMAVSPDRENVSIFENYPQLSVSSLHKPLTSNKEIVGFWALSRACLELVHPSSPASSACKRGFTSSRQQRSGPDQLDFLCSAAQQLKLRGSSSRYRVEQVLNCGCAEQWLKLIRTYFLDLN